MFTLNRLLGWSRGTNSTVYGSEACHLSGLHGDYKNSLPKQDCHFLFPEIVLSWNVAAVLPLLPLFCKRM
jgi:hypothetical protein